MKKNMLSFLSGFLTMLLFVCLPITALATSGAIKIEVSPINVLVNGAVFRPMDANGNGVMVFTYNGTTYAPLRALAEAYGLEVGYDARNNIATVNSPAAQAPQTGSDYASFSGKWIVKEKSVTNYGDEKIFTMIYSGDLNMNEFKEWWKSFDKDTIKDYAERMAAEAQFLVPGYTVTAYFSYDQYHLGTVHADGVSTGSNFNAAGVWIK